MILPPIYVREIGDKVKSLKITVYSIKIKYKIWIISYQIRNILGGFSAILSNLVSPLFYFPTLDTTKKYGDRLREMYLQENNTSQLHKLLSTNLEVQRRQREEFQVTLFLLSINCEY